MKDLYDLVNLSNIPLEKRIQLSIYETKKELQELTTERTCKLYSRYLFSNLTKNHIVSKIISTKDLGAEYDHFFNLVPINTLEYYLIDLTYPQFQNNKVFKELYEKGYEKIDIPSDLSLTAAPQRDVDIVTKPSAEGHMPAPPQFLYGSGKERLPEIIRKLYPKESCHSS